MDIFENYPLLDKDKRILEKTRVPIVTVSASFRDELARFHNISSYFGKTEDEVVFSRAHYSMALGAAVKAWGSQVNPSKAWLVDPTNYVTRQDWKKVEFTEEVGKAMARNSFLKKIKDLIDSRARSKLPITQAITTPLLYLFEHVHTPILSFHYETGNILAGVGKHVVQVVTDPHVREHYLEHAELPTMRFCVFDEKTKVEFLEKADLLDKQVDHRRVIVTGPPIDPRIVKVRSGKSPQDHKTRPLRLVITTGGLGNNKQEIEQCVRSLVPLLKKQTLQLIVYVSTHEDFRESIHAIARQEGVPTAERHEYEASLRILHSPNLVEANELLIKYGFPWADGFITKPSGDMAYDAAAAGCFFLSLEPWGEWEYNIREIFEQRGISRRAVPEDLAVQIESLCTERSGKSWVEKAIEQALELPRLFLDGTENILKQMPR